MKLRSLFFVALMACATPLSAGAQDSLVHELNLSEKCEAEFYAFDHQPFDTGEPEGRVTVTTPKPLSLLCKAEVVRNMMAHPDRPKVLVRPSVIQWYDTWPPETMN